MAGKVEAMANGQWGVWVLLPLTGKQGSVILTRHSSQDTEPGQADSLSTVKH